LYLIRNVYLKSFVMIVGVATPVLVH
jgi:hypothetical protein